MFDISHITHGKYYGFILISNSLESSVLLMILSSDFIISLLLYILYKNIVQYCANSLLDHTMLKYPFSHLYMNAINLEVEGTVESVWNLFCKDHQRIVVLFEALWS